MVTVYIGLGSNVGDRLGHLQAAVDLLSKRLAIEAASRVYESAPMYVTDQPAFFNAALKACTKLSPMRLLGVLKETEKQVGRQARERFGPREVDLDLVAYGGIRYAYRKEGQIVLQLPHPRTPERRFVLQPLHDLDPAASLPGLGRVSDLLANTADQAGDVVPVEHAVLSL